MSWRDEPLVSRSAWRNGAIGVGVSFAILAIAVILLHDAGDGVWGAVGMFAFFLAPVIAHILDELERRRKRDR